MKNSSACAVCKSRRRRCSPDCILRPYFPAEESTEFENANRLFGVNKIEKILREIHVPGIRDDAAKAIKYESNIRVKYPDHGCMKVIWDLEKQIELYNAEIHRTRALNAQFKSALAAASQFPTPPPLNHNYFPGDLFSGGGGDYGYTESQLLPPLTENADHNYDNATEFLAAQQMLDSLSGEGHYGNSAYETSTHAQQQLPDSNNLYLPPLTENANHNYDDATEFLAAQQMLDFLSGEGHYGDSPYETSTHAQKQLPDSNNLYLPPLTENAIHNYDDATEILAVQQPQALPLDVPYSPNNDGQIQFDQTGGDQSVTDDFFSDGERYGNFASKKQKISHHPQQVLPNSNSLPSATENFNNNYDDPTDFFSFDFPYFTDNEQIPFIPTETGDESAKYMPKDDIGNPFS